MVSLNMPKGICLRRTDSYREVYRVLSNLVVVDEAGLLVQAVRERLEEDGHSGDLHKAKGLRSELFKRTRTFRKEDVGS
jgi:hypothetical protein